MFPLRDNIPTDRFPLVTVALIVANVLVYFLWQKGGLSLGSPGSLDYQRHVVEYGLIPYEVTNPGEHCEIVGNGIACEGQAGETFKADPQAATWITAFTSMFMHGGLLHLGGNMLFLWIFGNNVEDAMGKVRYVLFYLGAGLAAAIAQVLVGPNTAVPTIGASGAVAGVLGGYILLYPRARVLTFIFIIFFFTVIELPAFLVLGLWFVQQIAFGAADLNNAGQEGGVAYWAHIGGFAFGLLLVRLFVKRVKQTPARLPSW